MIAQSGSTRCLLLTGILVASNSIGGEAFLSSTSSSLALSSSSSASSSQLSSRAFVVQPLATSSNEAAFSAFADSLDAEPENETTTSSSSSKTATKEHEDMSWQAKLDTLLLPTTDLAERQTLLSELLNSNDAIRKSVMDALANGKIDPLLTPNQKKLSDGTRAVARQLANDILPQIGSKARSSPTSILPPPSSLEKVGSQLFAALTKQAKKNLDLLQEDLSDPINRIPQRLTQQTEDLVQEAKNVFLETPEGLKGPPYTVLESTESYEIRDYEGYTVVATAMEDVAMSGTVKGTVSDGVEPSNGKNPSADDLASTGSAFNTLAAYLFGANSENKSMEMTTPVSTTSLGEMRFYIAEDDVENLPDPLDDTETSIEISTIPPARLAVRKFTGFVTSGEISRQKETLLQALDLDGIELDVPHGAVVPHVIYQYNPPYTLPIVRRNEIAVPVRGPQDQVPEPSLKQEWSVEDEEEEEGDESSSTA